MICDILTNDADIKIFWHHKYLLQSGRLSDENFSNFQNHPDNEVNGAYPECAESTFPKDVGIVGHTPRAQWVAVLGHLPPCRLSKPSKNPHYYKAHNARSG